MTSFGKRLSSRLAEIIFAGIDLPGKKWAQIYNEEYLLRKGHAGSRYFY